MCMHAYVCVVLVELKTGDNYTLLAGQLDHCSDLMDVVSYRQTKVLRTWQLIVSLHQPTYEGAVDLHMSKSLAVVRQLNISSRMRSFVA